MLKAKGPKRILGMVKKIRLNVTVSKGKLLITIQDDGEGMTDNIF